MEEILVGMDLELNIANINYDVEKAYIDKNKYIFVVSSYDYADIPPKAKLVVRTSSQVYVTDVTITDKSVQEGEAYFTCEVPTLNFDLLKRNVLRIDTELPATYCPMEQGADDALQPLSPPIVCTIIDLSPQGCCIQIPRNEIPQALNYKNSPLYLQLKFVLTDSNGSEKAFDIIGKIANIKRSWKNDQIGLFFLTKSYEQYHFIERYCSKRQRQAAEADEKLQYRLVKILKPEGI